MSASVGVEYAATEIRHHGFRITIVRSGGNVWAPFIATRSGGLRIVCTMMMMREWVEGWLDGASYSQPASIAPNEYRAGPSSFERMCRLRTTRAPQKRKNRFFPAPLRRVFQSVDNNYKYLPLSLRT